MWNMMHNYRGKIDVEFMKMLIRFTWDGPDNPDMEEAARELNETKGGGGWDSRVGNMGNMYSAVMDLKEDKPGVFHLCTSAPSPLSEALTQHYWFFFRDPSYTFYELSLLATPAEIAQAAKHRASYDMYYANRAMLPLTIWDTPYAPLKQRFAEAVTESQKGDRLMQWAAKASGGKATEIYAKAIRCYTRCQARAKQVTESLTPPPRDPQDLGLGEWMGSWGDWTENPRDCSDAQADA